MSKAWILRAGEIEREWRRVDGDAQRFEIPRVLSLEERELPAPAPRQVRVRVLAASIEHNVLHAALADTVDIVRLRGGEMCPGNSFTGEVLETGAAVSAFRPGDIVISGGTSNLDPYGFPLRIPGYDQPRSYGCYAEETLVDERELRAAPLDCGLDLWQITAAPLRAATAFHLWRRGEALFRAKVPKEKLARLNVLAFGGGTSEFFLTLARSEGHRAFYCASNAARRAELASRGVEVVDQAPFERFASPAHVRSFARHVKRLTRGVGIHVLCDMYRGPVFEAGLSVMAREGVNVSAGWQLDTRVAYNSAALSIQQVTIDHVHGETVDGLTACIELFGDVLRPHLHGEIYRFEDLPRALAELQRNCQDGLAVCRVADEMPEAVRPFVRAA